MTHAATAVSRLPQANIRDRCRHPGGVFAGFPAEAVEAAIHSRFEEQAWRDPLRLAIQTDSGQLNYGELNAAANRLARAILAANNEAAQPVLLFLEKGASAIAAIFGVLKAGKIVVQLNPSYPRAILEQTIADSQSCIIVTNRRNRAAAAKLAGETITIIDIDDRDPSLGEGDLQLSISGDAPAFILFTSGSTGRSKGVIQTHRNVLHKTAAYTDDLRICAADRLSVLHSMSFMAATRNIFAALLNGATVLPFDLEQEGVHRVVPWLERQSITICHSPASIFRQFAESAEDCHLPSLRVLYVGNERVTPQDVELYRAHFSADCIFVSALATTETGTVCQYFFDKSTPTPPEGVPVGYAVRNMEVLLLDDNGNAVAAGAPGEIGVRSSYNSPGYWRNPVLTKERFLIAGDGQGKTIYRTGDLGRMLPDGCLLHLGRKDFQLKIGGQRIDVSSIEDFLRAHDGIQDAVVQAREDVNGNSNLTAYFIAKRAPAPGARDLRQFLQERLPSYMVPSVFQRLEALPRTPHGKVDRRALLALPLTHPEPVETFVAPATPAERELAAIWAEELSLASVGTRHNFLELGGSSLTALRIMSRIRSTIQVDLPLHTIWENPTVASLAQVIVRCQSVAAASAALLPLRTDGAPLPLSFAQQRLWFLYRWDPESSIYNNLHWIRIAGALEIPALEGALEALTARHEILRTTIAEFAHGPVQVIGPPPRCPLSVVELDHVPESRRAGEAAKLAREEGLRPFDLVRSPAFRVKLYRVAEREHYLLLAIHHIASDAWSMGLLLRELALLYEALSTGVTAQLPELPIQYADYAIWQRQSMQGEPLQRQLHYWTNRLGGDLPVLQLPSIAPRPAMPSGRGETESFCISEEWTTRARALARENSSTLFMLSLAVFKLLLHRCTGQQDIIVGSPVGGRDHTEFENLIGCFINTLALRTDLSGDPSFRELLGRVRETCLGAYAHHELPLEKLIEELNPERTPSHSPLFQAMFIWQDAPPPQTLTTSKSILTISPLDTGTAKFDLTVSMMETGEGLFGSIEYSTDLFDREAIRRLLSHWRILFEGAVDHPDALLSELPILKSAERLWLREAGSGPRHELPPVAIHRLFEMQAARTPDSIAVESGRVSLTYGELNEKANRLARRLREAGARCGTLVGLCVERTCELATALLAILKTGAAYVPFDRALPCERWNLLKEDAEPTILLTERPAADPLPFADVPLIYCDEGMGSGADLDSQVKPEDLAYVLYTSGSTGKPKGVEVQHSAAVNLLLSMQSQPGLTASDTLLAVTPISFDIAVLELFLPLITGAKLVIATREEALDPARLMELMRKCSIMQATPTTWRALVDSGWQGSHRLKVLCGGEALLADLARELLSRACEVWNMYGPTETTVWSTVHKLNSLDRCVPIGRPIANTEVWVLDAHRNPVPIHIPGELYIGGDGLARGYHNQPEFTTEKFLNGPFPFTSAQRLYRTGDLVRWLPGGDLEFLGRLDDQVKIRGFRIEPGDVRAAILAFPGVREAAVVACESPGIGKSLAAYVVTRQKDEPLSVDNLRNFLARQLPKYMLPSAFVFLDELPITTSGKLDIRALPAPETSGATCLDEKENLRNAFELRLARIWEKLLHTRSIRFDQDFFELGGHSLLALKLIASVEREFGSKLPLPAVFQAPTIEGLAALLEDKASPALRAKVTAIQPFGSLPPFFCVAAYSNFRSIAARLGADRPFLGLPPPDPSALSVPYRLEDIAAQLVRTLREVQPTGPYILGGWCNSGIIAYEIAQQLCAQKQEVDLLVLFDSINPAARRHLPYGRVVASKFKYHFGKLADLRQWEPTLRSRWETMAGAVRQFLWSASYQRQLRAGRAVTGRVLDFQQIETRAVRDYQPKPYSGRTLLFRATDRPSMPYPDSAFGWSELVGPQLDVINLEAHHHGMLEAQANLIAQKLNLRLEDKREWRLRHS